MSLTDEAHAVPIPPRFWWLKRILIASGVLLVLLIGLRWWWGSVAHRKLQAEIDRIIAAGEPIYPEDFDPEPVPDDQNAALLLQEAAIALTFTAEQTKFFDELLSYTRLSDEHLGQVREIVEANQEALTLAHQARFLTGVDWGLRMRSPAFNFLLPNLTSQRRLAKVLCLTASYQQRIGNDAAAIETLRDLMSMSGAMDRMPTLISHLVAVAMEGLMLDSIENITPDLKISDTTIPDHELVLPANRAQVEALITELLDEEDLKQGLVRAMQCERMFQLDVVQLVTTGRTSLTAVSGWGVGAPAPVAERAFIFPFKPLFVLDGVHMLNHMAAMIQAASKSNWPGANEIITPLETQAEQVRVGMNRYVRLLSRLLLPSMERAVVAHFRSIAKRRMAAVALAIRLYEIDHGSRPEKLDDLAPGYLSEIPEDSFAGDDRKISYLPNAKRPLLYSIGRDGKDDGGKYSDNPEEYVEWKKYDIPFFLNGDRPHKNWKSTTPSPPSSTQADKDSDDVKNNDGQDDEAQDGQSQP